MVFENEEEYRVWLKSSDLSCRNMQIIAIIELAEIYQDVHQAIETLSSYSKNTKQEWLDIYDEYCMTY